METKQAGLIPAAQRIDKLVSCSQAAAIKGDIVDMRITLSQATNLSEASGVPLSEEQISFANDAEAVTHLASIDTNLERAKVSALAGEYQVTHEILSLVGRSAEAAGVDLTDSQEEAVTQITETGLTNGIVAELLAAREQASTGDTSAVYRSVSTVENYFAALGREISAEQALEIKQTIKTALTNGVDVQIAKAIEELQDGQRDFYDAQTAFKAGSEQLDRAYNLTTRDDVYKVEYYLNTAQSYALRAGSGLSAEQTKLVERSQLQALRLGTEFKHLSGLEGVRTADTLRTMRCIDKMQLYADRGGFSLTQSQQSFVIDNTPDDDSSA